MNTTQASKSKLEELLIEAYEGIIHDGHFDDEDVNLNSYGTKKVNSILKELAQHWYSEGFEDGSKYPYQTNFDKVWEEELTND